MDSDTEMSRTVKDGGGGAQAMDTDVNLDTLVRKAVTVSQANLPIATINQDIDDIARACGATAKENEHVRDIALDDDFVQMMEKTRQRRELLDQKLARGPEAAPRKRRTPLAEDLTNVGHGADSPKRQCLRDEETSIKPDTPAISSVKSRLHALSSQRAYWNDNDDTAADNPDDSSCPMPVPRKSVPCASEEVAKPKPPVQDHHQEAGGSNPQPSSSLRKNRFAQLASNISNWEDDLSHPTIVKEEEKKPRWQPPAKASENAVPALSSSSSSSSSLAATTISESPKNSARSPVKASAASALSRPTESSQEQESQAAAGEIHEEKEEAAAEHLAHAEQSSRMSAAAKSRRKEEEEKKETLTSILQKDSSAVSKNREEGKGREAVVKDEGPKAASVSQDTPKPVIPPSERPLSARLANWEQKISDNMTEASVVSTPTPPTPRPAVQATPQGKGNSSISQTPTARKICSTPQARDSEVQLRPRPRRTVEDEPTAHPVSARMSAWETISSNHEVGSIKKVKPGDAGATPAKIAPGGQKCDGTPARPVTKEGIKERIAQLSTPQKAAGSAAGVTPSKVLGSGTKSGAQWQPAQQMQSSDVAAQRLRQQRMAEVQGLQQQAGKQNRWKHPIRDEATGQASEVPKAGSSAKKDRRQEMREKARAEFDSRLASVGLDATSKKEAAAASQEAESSSAKSVVTGKPPRPTSLFSVVSQQAKEGTTGSPRPVTPATITSRACRKVKFDDSFDSDNGDKKPIPGHDTAREVDANTKLCATSADVGGDDDVNDDGDTSITAFEPRSVHFDCGQQDLDGSINSLDSFEGNPGAPPLDFHRSTVDLVKLGQQYPDSDPDSSFTQDTGKDTAEDSGKYNVREAAEESGKYNVREAAEESGRHRAGEAAAEAGEGSSRTDPQEDDPEDLEDSLEDRAAVDDLLDEALDAEEENDEVPVMRKKNPQREAAGGGNLPFSINEYRASRNLQIQEVRQTIVRNSQYVGMTVREEDVEMPTAPIPAPRQCVQDKIKELQELVQQEQNVIMQTSNAINQCCSSSFAGSSEQVECNKILLLSCQRRQAYMTEIQRLKDSGVVDPSGPGPKGSLTITDIRLPLKKDFVTKIGTSHDTMKYFFMLLVRNGPQIIFTQMLSTHDPMMRGSLDFPNLIKVNGITGNFQLQMDIYCMSVSSETSGKDKKKKTPKKMKGSALTAQSPGGPLAVRMTSFSQVTSVMLDMKSVDKQCFSLDRLSHLSPLHGTIYMKLNCLMEAGVEERGFLTMFEDVSGLGSWHRRWCVLSDNKLQFWKYPDDETRKEPMGYIDLKRCVTEKVGLISRDICARPHTFELMSVRQPKKGEKDTLISRTYTTMTTIRHMLSADTKEERIVWCNKVNRALAILRTWNPDALRPIPK